MSEPLQRNSALLTDDSSSLRTRRGKPRMLAECPLLAESGLESRAMPIYEYACRACGHEFETLVRGSEKPSCVQCSSAELDKKLSVFAKPGAEQEPVSACGSCGHPGGPRSCALN